MAYERKERPTQSKTDWSVSLLAPHGLALTRVTAIQAAVLQSPQLREIIRLGQKRVCHCLSVLYRARVKIGSRFCANTKNATKAQSQPRSALLFVHTRKQRQRSIHTPLNNTLLATCNPFRTRASAPASGFDLCPFIGNKPTSVSRADETQRRRDKSTTTIPTTTNSEFDLTANPISQLTGRNSYVIVFQSEFA